MSHLKDETLARLVDDEATSLEAAHLAECEACRAELDAMRADTQALAGLGDIAPPEHAWSALATRLESEGLVRRTQRTTPVLWRLAAALALFLTGTMAGFAWRTATLPEPAATLATSDDAGTTHTQQPQDVAVPTPGATARDDDRRAAGSDAPDAGAQQTEGGAQQTDAGAQQTESAPSQLATADTRRAPSQRADSNAPAMAAERSTGATSDPSRGQISQPRIIGPAPADPRFAALPQFATPRTAQEAAVLLRDAEGAYLNALVSYSQLAGDADETGDPMARLAALEGIVLSTRAALDRAPADPIINGYHMTALAQREATLRQIAATTRNPWF